MVPLHNLWAYQGFSIAHNYFLIKILQVSYRIFPGRGRGGMLMCAKGACTCQCTHQGYVGFSDILNVFYTLLQELRHYDIIPPWGLCSGQTTTFVPHLIAPSSDIRMVSGSMCLGLHTSRKLVSRYRRNTEHCLLVSIIRGHLCTRNQ